jgi:hypothetical protein
VTQKGIGCYQELRLMPNTLIYLVEKEFERRQALSGESDLMTAAANTARN